MLPLKEMGSSQLMSADQIPCARPESRPLVFVVDDEKVLLDLAETILTAADCAVRTFPDAESALAALIAGPALPRLIITDFAMGRMTGMDLIRESKRIDPGQRTLLISGVMEEFVCRDSPVKADGFLPKPYGIAEFTTKVRALLAGPHEAKKQPESGREVSAVRDRLSQKL